MDALRWAWEPTGQKTSPDDSVSDSKPPWLVVLPPATPSFAGSTVERGRHEGRMVMTREMTTSRTASEIIDWIAVRALTR